MFDSLDHSLSSWIHSQGPVIEALARLLLAAEGGGLVGLEREIHGRQAGLRTNLLVSIGSALVMIVSASLALHDWPSPGKPGVQVSVDPGRIAYGVMAGIGFLGAGTIMHNKGSLRGLTTAAALWCVATLGLAAGAGLYLVAAFATLIILIVLWVLPHLESLIPQTYFRYVTVRVRWRNDCIERTVRHLENFGLRVTGATLERTGDDALVEVQVAFSSRKDFLKLATTIASDPTFQLIATRELQK
jgi:putative Mg2+ transporter-C (MgtC) family protein